MILGRVRDSLPRVTLDLPSAAGSVPVEFILDTGFEGDLTLPRSVLLRLEVRPLFLSLRSMADGTLRECPVYQLAMEWNEELRDVEILCLEHNPLLGTLLLEGWHVAIDLVEGGEVLLESGM